MFSGLLPFPTLPVGAVGKAEERGIAKNCMVKGTDLDTVDFLPRSVYPPPLSSINPITNPPTHVSSNQQHTHTHTSQPSQPRTTNTPTQSCSTRPRSSFIIAGNSRTPRMRRGEEAGEASSIRSNRTLRTTHRRMGAYAFPSLFPLLLSY
jgi:hypothetical protein